MKKVDLLSPYKLGTIDLRNRIVMAPMTRSRAIGNIPDDLMAEFYGQRAAAGLIITEGTPLHPTVLDTAASPAFLTDNRWKVGKKSQRRCMPKTERSLSSSCTPGASAIRRIW